MQVKGVRFNSEWLKGKSEAQIRKGLSGYDSDILDELVNELKKKGLLKTKKKKKDSEEGGE